MDSTIVTESQTASNGGPTSYYDFGESWTTLNDMMEEKALTQWGAFSLHLKDIGKAIFRFGAKQGIDYAYDARKIVYSGLRLLIMLEGKGEAQAFLKTLTEDRQFRP